MNYKDVFSTKTYWRSHEIHHTIIASSSTGDSCDNNIVAISCMDANKQYNSK